MKIEIPLTEIHEFLSNFYNVEIDLNNIDKNKIEIHYFAALVLNIKEVSEDRVVFYYEGNDIVNLLAKVAHFLLKKKLDLSIEWNSKTNEVSFDLKKIPQLSNFLELFYISELKFEHDNIILGIKYKMQ